MEHVSKSYGARRVLDDCNLEVREGEVMVVIGASGVGKSTLLRLIIGLDRPDTGRVLVGEQVVHGLRPKQLRRLRRWMGYLFQFGALINWLTLRQNVALPLQENKQLPRDRIDAKVTQTLALVGLAGKGPLMPDQLSGGMRKRGGLARCLVTDPKIILYDEPTTGLDPVTAHVIDRIILDLQRRLGVTSVVVSHDMEGAFRVADRIAMLHEGRILAIGTPEEIRASSDPVVQQFVTGSLEGPLADFSRKESEP
ncbi:MAG: ABC transporter ATP-binding protein [Planctomycetota bacterium]